MNNRLYVALSLIVGLASIGAGAIAPAVAADKLENIPLVWKPTSPMSERAALDMKGLDGAKLQIDPFIDNRADKSLLGLNKSKVPNRKVTTQEDVARFVTYQMKTLMSAQGVPIVDTGGTVVMKGWIKRFYAEDASRYNADVDLELTFTDAETGKILWSFMTSGNSSRYGITYKADNYYEVLSDALVGATHELLRNPKFKEVLNRK
ncbi:MAG: hypothetical protein H7Z41_09375 [Cytophagales bacterium]|nr:hypothetical protein [Armatimonadota bacterium]